MDNEPAKVFLVMGNDFAPAIILAAVVILFVIIMRYTVWTICLRNRKQRGFGKACRYPCRPYQRNDLYVLRTPYRTCGDDLYRQDRAIQPSAGVGYEMDAIGAVVLEASASLEEKALLSEPYWGAILMGLLMNGMTLLKISADFQGLITGVIILTGPAARYRQNAL